MKKSSNEIIICTIDEYEKRIRSILSEHFYNDILSVIEKYSEGSFDIHDEIHDLVNDGTCDSNEMLMINKDNEILYATYSVQGPYCRNVIAFWKPFENISNGIELTFASLQNDGRKKVSEIKLP